MRIYINSDYCISISKGNNKMGKVPSLSVLPGVTCHPGVPCFKDCYARKMCSRRDTIATAYRNNTEAIRNLPPKEIIDTLAGYINWTRCRYFRWNVSGDFNIRNYWDITVAVAERCPETKFMAFTKCYEFQSRKRPKNFNLILSAWHDYQPGKNPKCGIAYLDDGTYPIPSNAKECPGNCEKCGKCFNLKAGEAVYFNKH